jgi:hypothetical protein
MNTSDMATPETQFVTIQTMQQPSAVLAPPCLWVTKALAFEVRREQPDGNRWLCKGPSAVSLLPRGASISIEQCIKEALAKAQSSWNRTVVSKSFQSFNRSLRCEGI